MILRIENRDVAVIIAAALEAHYVCYRYKVVKYPGCRTWSIAVYTPGGELLQTRAEV